MSAEWDCPRCGTRLSYGVYCKTCQVEPGLEVRPATARDIELARLRAVIAALPVPAYPVFTDD